MPLVSERARVDGWCLVGSDYRCFGGWCENRAADLKCGAS